MNKTYSFFDTIAHSMNRIGVGADSTALAVTNFVFPDLWVALSGLDFDVILLGPGVKFKLVSSIMLNWFSSDFDAEALVV